MEVLVQWFTDNLSQHISRELIIFIISMIPILELRGGLLAASLLKVSAVKAIPICIIGNIIPIPFILLFIRQIFKVLKKTKLFHGLIVKMEDRAMGKSDQIKRYEFFGLLLFVGIPLPGTGAWTGYQEVFYCYFLWTDHGNCDHVCGILWNRRKSDSLILLLILLISFTGDTFCMVSAGILIHVISDKYSVNNFIIKQTGFEKTERIFL